MRISQYLFRRSSGYYYFRIRTPLPLRETFLKNEIKFSLRTKNKAEAKKRVLPYISFIAKIECMTDIEEIVRQLKASGMKTMNFELTGLRIGNVEIDSLSVDPSKRGDVDDAISFVSSLHESNNVAAEPRAEQKIVASPVRLQEIINQYVEELSAEKWNKKTRDENVQLFNLLLRILGKDAFINSLSDDTGRKVKSILMKLPANINKSPKYRDKSIDEILALGDKPRSITTVNKLITRYSSLFEYAVRHKYVSSNFFDRLTIKTKSNKKEKRTYFTDDQLSLLFAQLNLVKPLHSYYYWLPRIALYTGMRLNEICQLSLDDIREIDGVYIFDINDSESLKRLKTAASKRFVPIHEQLLQLGLIDHVNKLRLKNEIRLFPELKHDGYSYVAQPSKWFARVREKLNWVNLSPKLDFHSFRHNVATTLQQNDVPEYRVNAILGHDAVTESFQRYGKGFAIETVKADIDSIVFSVPEITE